MASSTETQPPFADKHGIRLRWDWVWKAVGILTPLVFTIVMLFLSSRFASNDHVQRVEKTVEGHGTKLDSLTEFRTRTEANQDKLAQALNRIATEQAAQRAIMDELGKQNVRIYNRLDQLADRK